MIVSQNIYALAAGIDYDGNNITFVEANENTSSETEETNSINIDALEGIDFSRKKAGKAKILKTGICTNTIYSYKETASSNGLTFPWNGMTLC